MDAFTQMVPPKTINLMPIFCSALYFRTQQAMTRFIAALVLQIVGIFTHHLHTYTINLNNFSINI